MRRSTRQGRRWFVDSRESLVKGVRESIWSGLHKNGHHSCLGVLAWSGTLTQRGSVPDPDPEPRGDVDFDAKDFGFRKGANSKLSNSRCQDTTAIRFGKSLVLFRMSEWPMHLESGSESPHLATLSRTPVSHTIPSNSPRASLSSTTIFCQQHADHSQETTVFPIQQPIPPPMSGPWSLSAAPRRPGGMSRSVQHLD